MVITNFIQRLCLTLLGLASYTFALMCEEAPFLLSWAATDACDMYGVEEEVNSGNLGFINANDWMAYKFAITEAGTYLVTCEIASPDGYGSFQIEDHETSNVYGYINVLPATTRWHNWEPVSQTVSLPAGDQALKIRATSAGWNLKSVSITKSDGTDTSPCSGSQPIVAGMDGSFYIAATTYCSGLGVMAEPSNVGYIDEGDSIAYRIELTTPGKYQVVYRVSSYSGEGSFRLESYDGRTEYGSISDLPSTGGWYNWEEVSHEVVLSEGVQTLVVKATAKGWNLQSLRIIVIGEHTDAVTVDDVPQDDVDTNTDPGTSGDDSGSLSCSQAVPLSQDHPGAQYCTSRKVVVDGSFASFEEESSWVAYNVPFSRIDQYSYFFSVSSENGEGAFQLEVYGKQNSLGAVVARIRHLPATGDGFVTLGPFDVTMGRAEYTVLLRSTTPGWKLLSFRVQPKDLGVFEPMPTPVSTPKPVSAPVTPTSRPSLRPQLSPPTTSAFTPTPRPVTPVGSNNGFVKASGKRLVDGSGENLLLRGYGFGGWMLQEPYMMLTDNVKHGEHQIFAQVEDLTGPEIFKEYHRRWLDNWCTEEDIVALKDQGFNSLRLAMHYKLLTLPIESEPTRGQDTWLEEGFVRIDRLLQWCKTAGIYLILDLHAAPGGQGRDANINDYDDTKPSMWEDTENVRKTVALWVRLAARYKDETMIAAYDLINEPNWNFDPGHPNGCSDRFNRPLKSFYDEAIREIRKVDTNHLIVIEGNCWSNNHDGLWPFSDNNLVLSLHRYWVDNTVSSIQKFLDLQNRYNIPLWMGESGENNSLWYEEAVRLLENYNIGWAWWTWKKLNSRSGAYSIKVPDGYWTLKSYWENGGNRPDPDFATKVMFELAENSKLENCEFNHEVIRALTGFGGKTCDESEAIPVTGIVRLEAEDYCEMFGMSSEESQDVGGGYNLGWIDAGDYLDFQIDINSPGQYQIAYRVASETSGGGFRTETSVGGVSSVLGALSVPVTGGWQAWQTVQHSVRFSTAGVQKLKFVATVPGFNINWIEIS